ncbi:hypothetical protein ACMD2_22322 [Ananas comosus]|uniref:Uncharacterized protein n=1 Tax=Ananas comosus TaxID=4615 RepID=A0A199UGB9_ANACO|nr:hypothetical protein ACMD2_22322 [Ananas comosus]
MVDNCFAHLYLAFKFHYLTEEVDGILGRTYRKNYTSRAKVGAAKPVLGGGHEFTASGLFTMDCAAFCFLFSPTDIPIRYLIINVFIFFRLLTFLYNIL